MSPSPARVVLLDSNREFHTAAIGFLRRRSEFVVLDPVLGDAGDFSRLRDLSPDVVLVDMDPPEGVGVETIHQLRSVLPETGIVALSLCNDRIYLTAAQAAGANDLVCKAALVTDLVPAILRVWRHAHSQRKGDARLDQPARRRADSLPARAPAHRRSNRQEF